MKIPRKLKLWFYKASPVFLIFILCFPYKSTYSQCLSSANPVGGANNLLVLEKNTFRIISFYKYHYGNQYFEKNKHSSYDLIDNASYNYFGNILGYGLTNHITLETELGYFINKTQIYNLDTNNKLRGSGLSNAVFTAKYGLYKDHFNRIYITTGLGTKIPFSRELQIKNGVELPVEVQPTLGSYGIVFQALMVKEDSGKGLRYFLTNRTEYNFSNQTGYKPGAAVFTSFFFSKHLMYPCIKGDWTTIIQLRNEIRFKDKINDAFKNSSGSTIFFLSPQINYSYKKKWNFSILFDIPVYQYLQGIQIGSKFGASFIFSRDFQI